MIQRIFSRLGDSENTQQWFSLLIIPDGIKAIENIRETPFDLILLDISLPRASGFQVLTEARRCHIYTPIIMFSSSEDIEDIHYAYFLGANGYILKSGSLKDIQLRLASVCECYFKYLSLPCQLS